MSLNGWPQCSQVVGAIALTPLPNRYRIRSCLRNTRKGYTQILPVNIGAQIFGEHGATRFGRNAKAKPITQTLVGRYCLAEVANRGFTPGGKYRPGVRVKTVEIGEQLFHMRYSLPVGIVSCQYL